MTLSELATHVGNVTGMTETDDIAAAKSFLTAKHRLMWNHQLWKDSLVEYNATLSPDDYTPDSVWLPASGVLLLPASIQKVIAVRSRDYHLNVRRQEFFYRQDYNAFAATGTPYEFVVLPPCVWQTDYDIAWQIYRSDSADASQSVSVDTLDADGVSLTRTSYPLTTATVEAGETNRIDSVIKPATNGSVTLGVSAYVFTGAGTDGVNQVFYESSTPGEYISHDGAYYMVVSGAGQIFNNNTDELLYTGGPSGQWATVNGGVSPAPLGAAIPALISLSASELVAPKRQRIRLVRIPAVETTVRVLGKRNPPSFTADSDEPGINGSEDYLIAFASAQMWERARQFGKKQLLMEEADALLGDLIKQETVQQAHHLSIVPEDGMGSELYSFGGFNGLWP